MRELNVNEIEEVSGGIDPIGLVGGAIVGGIAYTANYLGQQFANNPSSSWNWTNFGITVGGTALAGGLWPEAIVSVGAIEAATLVGFTTGVGTSFSF